MDCRVCFPFVSDCLRSEVELLIDENVAEYARVPFADDSLIPVPLTHETTNSSVERDYLTTGDIFATGWSAIDYSGFQPGDTVAVFGAGASQKRVSSYATWSTW